MVLGVEPVPRVLLYRSLILPVLAALVLVRVLASASALVLVPEPDPMPDVVPHKQPVP